MVDAWLSNGSAGDRRAAKRVPVCRTQGSDDNWPSEREILHMRRSTHRLDLPTKGDDSEMTSAVFRTTVGGRSSNIL